MKERIVALGLTPIETIPSVASFHPLKALAALETGVQSVPEPTRTMLKGESLQFFADFLAKNRWFANDAIILYWNLHIAPVRGWPSITIDRVKFWRKKLSLPLDLHDSLLVPTNIAKRYLVKQASGAVRRNKTDQRMQQLRVDFLGNIESYRLTHAGCPEKLCPECSESFPFVPDFFPESKGVLLKTRCKWCETKRQQIAKRRSRTGISP